MNIPTLPHGRVIDKDGYLTDSWESFFIQLIQIMNQNLSNEGFVMPSQTTTNINLLTASPNGTIIYDSTANKFKGRESGSWIIIA